MSTRRIEVLEPYYDSSFRARLPDLERHKKPNRQDGGASGVAPGRHKYEFGTTLAYRRFLGEAAPREMRAGNFAKFQGTRFASDRVTEDNVDGRIQDMDEEGVDVQLMVPTPPVGVQCFLMTLSWKWDSSGPTIVT